MIEKRSKNLLLIIILAIAFAYRFFLVTMNTYPPGADIGLHESVIASITSTKPSFFWNYYQMGGGLSATNPGYHIFTIFIISMTGLPDYLAQALVASFFSAFLVMCAFLIVRQVWSELAGFIAAVLISFSAADIIMLSWAGYPNIVALMLLAGVFYLFLHPSKLSSKSYVVVASILVSAIFLTHVFSGFIFVGITLFALFVSGLFSKRTGITRRQASSWLVSIGGGLLLVSPYLFNVIPIYFGSTGTIIDASSQTSQAVLETRLAPLEIICLSLVPVFLFFVFSKYKQAKFLSVPAILFASWLLVPALGTQSYLFGVYLDYERFLYFLALPAIICLSIVVASLPNVFSWTAQTLQKSLKTKISFKPVLKVSKKVATAIFLVVMIVLVLFTPLFSLPNKGVVQADYFQVMNPSEYQAIQWVKANTSVGSVCVADAEFGWWLSGFAQRPTLSAVDPQYLILQHEVGPAAVATDLLKADYMVDNGLIEVQQAGAYSNDNTHEILAVSNSSYVHSPVFILNDAQISLLYRQNGLPQQLSLSGLTQTNTVVESNAENASFVVTRENNLFKIIEQITVYKGVGFAQISFVFQGNCSSVNFDWLQLPFEARGFPVQSDNSIGIVDNVLHEVNQLVFPSGELGNNVVMLQNSNSYELSYNLQGNTSSKISFFVGRFQFNAQSESNQTDYWNKIIDEYSSKYLDKTSNQQLNYFDYQTAIQEWNISYIAIRDFTQIPRFSDDPMFTLVFKNDQVAIFEVNKS
jgi:hypothetical protein